tara:strand:- start:16163 stop:16681 length:519 start_codon:yes stop_codon:yes gene_type:complete
MGLFTAEISIWHGIAALAIILVYAIKGRVRRKGLEREEVYDSKLDEFCKEEDKILAEAEAAAYKPPTHSEVMTDFKEDGPKHREIAKQIEYTHEENVLIAGILNMEGDELSIAEKMIANSIHRDAYAIHRKVLKMRQLVKRMETDVTGHIYKGPHFKAIEEHNSKLAETDSK